MKMKNQKRKWDWSLIKVNYGGFSLTTISSQRLPTVREGKSNKRFLLINHLFPLFQKKKETTPNKWKRKKEKPAEAAQIYPQRFVCHFSLWVLSNLFLLISQAQRGGGLQKTWNWSKWTNSFFVYFLMFRRCLFQSKSRFVYAWAIPQLATLEH